MKERREKSERKKAIDILGIDRVEVVLIALHHGEAEEFVRAAGRASLTFSLPQMDR